MNTHSVCLCLYLIVGIVGRIQIRIVSQKVEVWAESVDPASLDSTEQYEMKHWMAKTGVGEGARSSRPDMIRASR